MDINRTNPNGEPGFFFTNSLEYGCNPCGEIGLNPKLNGETGFAFCNLTEVNVAACKAHTDFIHAAICAAYLGTFQATYTDFKVLTDVSKHIAEREALIGVGLTGLADNPTILEDEKLLHNAAREVVNANEQLAMELGINAAARCTTIKPSGTASLS
jgi:ribonucleoside-diphosphate reductase alpha chain